MMVATLPKLEDPHSDSLCPLEDQAGPKVRTGRKVRVWHCSRKYMA